MPWPSLTSDLTRRVVLAGVVALALLGMGEAAPAAALVRVAIEAHGDRLTVDVDGKSHQLESALGGNWRDIALESPGPLEREYQIDGSDTTASNDRQPDLIHSLEATPLYAFDAWLRDESSYSRWEDLRIEPLSTAAPGALPRDFRVTVGLRRPEAPAHVWLRGVSGDDREGLELDRDRRNARWIFDRDGTIDALPRWFFPEQPAPFAADLLHLVGRSAMAGFCLSVAALLVGRLSAMIGARCRIDAFTFEVQSKATTNVLLAIWLLGAALVTTLDYHQLPHILDGVSYTFQAGLLARGVLWLPSPPGVQLLRGPFQVITDGRWFSQYPPGAPVAYALGQLIGLRWLVGPLACLAMLAATAWVAKTLWGSATGLVVLLLGVLSPFVLFQSGSFLSHPIAGGLVAEALAAFVAAERSRNTRWFNACGALLGAAFLTREIASVLFALPLASRLVLSRRWGALVAIAIYGLPFVLLYLLYNEALTGSPWVLPRTLFDPSDHFGFGDGVGFHTRHTVAAGLVNTDEQLSLLQFDALGWPPLFAFGLIAVPFLYGRARAWDYMAAAGLLAFVAAYATYFYDGIALGPRYYFEAMPWLLLLAGRGSQILAQISGSRVAAAAVLGALALNALAFYLPHEIERRMDYAGMPDGRRLTLPFVRPGLAGPALDGVPTPSLVLTSDWWVYNAGLATLNCSRVPDCSVLFGYAPSDDAATELRLLYPGRQVERAVETDGRIVLQSLVDSH